MRPGQDANERHRATLRKYAPFKSLSKERMSPSTQHTSEINVLLHRWKPCPGDVSS